MKNKSLMLLMVAAGCGLVAMLGVRQLMSRKSDAPEKTRILVARTDIESGVPLDKTNVGFKEWPNDAIPKGAILTEEEFVDRALKHRVGPNQPILASELGNKGEFGLQIQIPKDMRLVSVPVTSTMTHSGLLRPGNFVDVSAVIDIPKKGSGHRTEVKPVLQCIQVFAVGSSVLGSEDAKDSKVADVKNVTFLVYPLQGQLLQLANKQSNGALQFALRSGSDKSLVNSEDLTDSSLSLLANSLMGNSDEPTSTTSHEPKPEGAKPKSAFRSYLAPETSSAMTTVGEQAVRPTWKIEIFQGEQRVVQEIELPEEKPAEASTKRTSASSTDWASPVLKFFSRRQKSTPESDLESPSTTEARRKKGTSPQADDTAQGTESTEKK